MFNDYSFSVLYLLGVDVLLLKMFIFFSYWFILGIVKVFWLFGGVCVSINCVFVKVIDFNVFWVVCENF